MELICQHDSRRDAVRSLKGWNGLDYVEVSEDQLELRVYFLGKLPPELAEKKPGIEHNLRLEGGQRVTNIQITDVNPVSDPDPESDDYLVIHLDKYGDFSTYTLWLVDMENIDPRYDHTNFSFKIDCSSYLDCAPECICEPPELEEPEINYLAKDYASFRQLILDRFAVLVPEWRERHVPDIGIALVELLAYTGDYLSYYQDAVATEAYLETARQRISVRRHARLVDYFLHEGCNARTWVCVEVSSDITLEFGDVAFITEFNEALAARQTVLSWDDLREISTQAYDVFEPKLLCAPPASKEINLYAAHTEIHFYTWDQRECCLVKGGTTATLLEQKDLPLKLQEGDVLIFEEVLGPKTGLLQDADPARRHAVRLTQVARGEDLAIKTKEGKPTSYVEIQWSKEDALPFPFCISAMGPASNCRYLDNISIARGNVILVDVGKTLDAECIGEVPTVGTDVICECVEQPGEIQWISGRFRPSLAKAPLTFSVPLPIEKQKPCLHPYIPCASLLDQDVRNALPNVQLVSLSGELRRYFSPVSPCDLEYILIIDDGGTWVRFPSAQLPADMSKRFPDGRLPAQLWEPRYDLLESSAGDYHFVVEIDNDGIAQLRFGDGKMGCQPAAGTVFFATYRVGNGVSGNVGAESISRLVLKNTKLDGVSITVRNPLPAMGGQNPEPLAEAKLYAPHLFRKRIERAITADDYRLISERNSKIQHASATLSWTGSWYEAEVAVDPWGLETADNNLLKEIKCNLHRYRRMGHDLHVKPALYVPLDLKLEVCVLPHYQCAHVKAALLAVFSNRVLAGGKRGFFHPDNLSFGEGIYLSRLVAAGQTVAGVECIRVLKLQRLFESANFEIENGLLALHADEIAQLDNDPNHPEHGKMDIDLQGGI